MTAGSKQSGITLVELMVALAIGSFLMIGAIQIYTQSRQAFIINESIARVQETAQFAMDIIENDMRMASNWGRTSRSLSIEGRAVIGNDNPNSVTVPTACGEAWVLDLATPIDGNDNTYALTCTPTGTAQTDSDVITVRRASVATAALQANRLQIQTTRVQGELFTDGTVPAAYDPAESATHNLMVTSYYVATDSQLIPGTPALRRKTLAMVAGAQTIIDQEVAPGVENIQIQLGVDTNDDNTVDRYVNPGSAIYNPGAVGYIPGAKVMTARVWLVLRSTTLEPGIEDNIDYEPGNVDLGVQNDSFRRMQVSKTILLRNART